MNDQNTAWFKQHAPIVISGLLAIFGTLLGTAMSGFNQRSLIAEEKRLQRIEWLSQKAAENKEKTFEKRVQIIGEIEVYKIIGSRGSENCSPLPSGLQYLSKD